MTKQDFIQYLSYPEKLDGQSISSLEKLVKEYPYFQIGRMLYLKNLHNENSIDYEKNLHITSAYAPNGKVLYNLIKKKTGEKPIERREKIIQQQTKEVIPKLEPITILQEMPMTAPAKEEKKDAELQLLEKEMLREAYRVSLTVDLLKEDIESPKPAVKVNPIITSTKNLKSGSYSFGDWMKVVSDKKLESAADGAVVPQKSKASIIDDFILDQSAKIIPKPRAEFYSAENMAKKSITDNENFVSETLAKIYLKQGNLPKALRSYEILLVKHPEKLHIFAPLLEKIKKLLEDQKSK